MAARAILRRKSHISGYTRSGLCNNFQNPKPQVFHFMDSIAATKYPSSTALEQCSRRRRYLSHTLLSNVRQHLVPPLGMGTFMRSWYKREDDVGLETGKAICKKKEECDKALQSLSIAKARATEKKLQEQKLVHMPVGQRVSNSLLRIGPAVRAVLSMSKEDWAMKLVDWKKGFMSTLHHYWLGCKLLYVDVKICSHLLLKYLCGKGLIRRERNQLKLTTVDLFKLVPLVVLAIVPLGEFVLVVIFARWPNFLPSTFRDIEKEKEAKKRELNIRMKYAAMIQEIAIAVAEQVQISSGGELNRATKDVDGFLNRIRKGARASNEEILSFAKSVKDEVTLDKMSRARLVSMCKYMGMKPYATNACLRYMLRNKLRRIKMDDKSIQEEGVESLSEAELGEVCRQRGILGSYSADDMRKELRDWLDLSLNHSLSSSLLILSRAFTVSGVLRPEETIQATLCSLPDDIVGIEEEIEEEELTGNEEEEKQEQLCELSRAFAVLASSSSVSLERAEFLRLAHKEIDIYNAMVQKDGVRASREEGEKDNKTAQLSSALLEKVDSMLQNLEKEIDDVDDQIGDSWQRIDKDFDGKVTPEEVASATKYLKSTLLQNEGITLQHLISTLAKDQDGRILVEDIIKLGASNGYSNESAPDLRI